MNELVESAVNEVLQKQDQFAHPDNKLGFILAKNLQAVIPKSTSIETIEPLAREFYDEVEKIGLMETRDCEEIDFDEFCWMVEDAWGKVDKSAAKFEQAISDSAQWLDKPLVTQVENIQTQKILAVCYQLQQIAGDGPFHLNQRAAGTVIGREKSTGGGNRVFAY